MINSYTKHTNNSGEILQIGDLCYLSMPCQHKIIIDLEPKGLWDGVKILRYMIDHHYEIDAHFSQYKKQIETRTALSIIHQLIEQQTELETILVDQHFDTAQIWSYLLVAIENKHDTMFRYCVENFVPIRFNNLTNCIPKIQDDD